MILYPIFLSHKIEQTVNSKETIKYTNKRANRVNGVNKLEANTFASNILCDCLVIRLSWLGAEYKTKSAWLPEEKILQDNFMRG